VQGDNPWDIAWVKLSEVPDFAEALAKAAGTGAAAPEGG
jgi:hypothetical protein